MEEMEENIAVEPTSKSTESNTLHSEMLLHAFKACDPSTCRYLLKKHSIDLEILETVWPLTPIQSEIKEWLKAISDVESVTPITLNHSALNQGFGFKSANLMCLDLMAEKLNQTTNENGTPLLTNCEVKIPPFIPVSDIEVRMHMQNYDPEIFVLWERFKESFDPQQVEAFTKEFSKQIEITKKGLDLLKEMGERIHKLFDDHPMDTTELREWLETNGEKPIIVRSTGKEDSDQLTNAGGNESIPFVNADIASINHAMGKVIGSYFCDPSTGDARSIKQRLAGGDASLFTDQVFLPVLLQQMVIEDNSAAENPDAVLRSGVLFTKPHDDFPESVLIQTGMGNNHGIVSSEVNVDSYTVENGKVRSIVRDKNTRFVQKRNPDGTYTLEKAMNSKNLAIAQALSQGTVRDLAATATSIANEYGAGKKKSMDVEYSIQRDPLTQKQTLYLLQARPLKSEDSNENKPKSFVNIANLEALAKKQPSDVILGKTLLDGKSYVREITSKNQVIIANDIQSALDAYHESKNKKDVQAIIIGKNALETSHPGVTLRSYGIPVLVIDDIDEFSGVNSLINEASEEEPILICPQRSAIVSTRHLQEIGADKHSFQKEGCIAYPGSLEASVPMNRNLMNAFADHDPHQLQQFLEGQEARYQLILKKMDRLAPQIGEEIEFNEFSLKRLIDEIALGDSPQSMAALKSLLRNLHQHIQSNLRLEAWQGTLQQQMSHYEMLGAFSAILEHVDKQLAPAIIKSAPSSIERLYHLKHVEALIFQPASKEIINGFSFRNALAIKKTGDSLGKIAQTPEAIALALHHKCALNPASAELWKTFIQKLEKESPQHTKDLYLMVQMLDEMQLTSLWMGLNGEKINLENPIETVENLQKDFNKSLKTFQWIKKENESLSHYEKSVNQWSDPQFYSSQEKQLTKDYQRWFFPEGNSLLKQNYESSDNLGKLAILQFFGRTVNAFDLTIKSIKGSENYEDERKLKIVAEMLGLYACMFEQSLTLISEDAGKEIMTSPRDGYLPLNEYTQLLRQGSYNKNNRFYSTLGQEMKGFDRLYLNALNGTAFIDEFKMRPEFTVLPLIIGSKTFSGKLPATLEEYFTTYHQNMEAVKNILTCQCGLDKKILSNRTREFVDEIEKKYHLKMSEINVDQEKVNVEFKIPLPRCHGVNLKVSYDPSDINENVSLSVIINTENENDRWELMTGSLAMLSSQPEISLSGRPKVSHYGFEVNLNLSKALDVKGFIELLDWLLIKVTIEEIDVEELINHLKTVENFSLDRIPQKIFELCPAMIPALMKISLEEGNEKLTLT